MGSLDALPTPGSKKDQLLVLNALDDSGGGGKQLLVAAATGAPEQQPPMHAQPPHHQQLLDAALGILDPRLPLAARAPHVAALLALLPPACPDPAAGGDALLQAGVCALVDACLAMVASETTPAALKLQAADALSALCGDRACSLLVCPGPLIERLRRAARHGREDAKAAAARALWQLACLPEYSSEVVRATGGRLQVGSELGLVWAWLTLERFEVCCSI